MLRAVGSGKSWPEQQRADGRGSSPPADSEAHHQLKGMNPQGLTGVYSHSALWSFPSGGVYMRPAVAALACFLAAPLFADDGNTVLLADLGDHAMQQDASPAGACAERPAI